MDWTPSDGDKQWMNNLIEHIIDGGVWLIPANGSVWKIHKSDKRVVLQERGNEPVLTEKTITAFNAVGFTVVEEANEPV